MKNNKGFTLIELVVVIALMAVIAGVSSYTLHTISKQELKDFTNNLDAMLCQCKVETMSGMVEPELQIAVIDHEYRATLYAKVKVEDAWVRQAIKSQYLGGENLTCRYYLADGDPSGIEYNGNGVISFKYNRNTGELVDKSIVAVSVSDRTGMYAIEFVPATGYHKIMK